MLTKDIKILFVNQEIDNQPLDGLCLYKNEPHYFHYNGKNQYGEIEYNIHSYNRNTIAQFNIDIIEDQLSKDK